MAATAIAELTIDHPLEQAFSRFIDYSSWDLWMPEDMRPISGPARGLREGDRVQVSIGSGRGRVRGELEVIRVRPNREICWRAGIPPLLVGEHSIFFRDEAGRTTLRSEEPFAGLLTLGPLGKSLERAACDHAAKLLSSFAAYLDKRA